MASTESPAKKPELIIPVGMSLPANRPAQTPHSSPVTRRTPAFFQDVRGSLEIDCRADANEEHSRERQRAGHPGIRERAERFAETWKKRVDGGSREQWNNHHSAGELLNGLLDLHRQTVKGERILRKPLEGRVYSS
jgi:hypothetical protein